MYTIYEQTSRKTGKKRIIAVSTYAGKIVKGIATCNPEDEYNAEKGIDLAMARCNAKVATKRRKNAESKLLEATTAYQAAKRRMKKMEQYFEDSVKAEAEANEELKTRLREY